MQKNWGIAAATVALLGAGTAARADLTLDGQTGLFFNPTAEIVEKGKTEVQFDYQRVDTADDSVNVYGIGGAIQVAKNLELSANFNRGSYLGEHANNWRLGGKYQILQQDSQGFDLAIGGSYEDFGLPSPVDLTHYGVYAAATKAFGNNQNRGPIKATVGVRWDHADLDISTLSSDDGSKTSFYGGVEVPLIKDGELSLVGELNSKILDGGKTPYALGLRYHPEDTGITFSAGLGRTNLFSLFPGTDTGFFFQVGYQFGN